MHTILSLLLSADRLEAARKDAVGLFYYAGHGVQVDGQNYLIPLNAEIARERHIAIEAVGASWALGQMEFAGSIVASRIGAAGYKLMRTRARDMDLTARPAQHTSLQGRGEAMIRHVQEPP